MAERIMGIEIGNNAIKLIETTRKIATLKVEKFALLETPKDSMKEGVMTNVEMIYEAISKAIREQKFQAKKVVLVVQGSSIIIRNIIMDKQPEKVIRQLLALKPQEYLPVEQGQYQIDFKIIREIEETDNTKIEVLLAAAPNHMILPLVNLVESLKLTPVLISLPSEALAKVFGDQTRMVHDVSEDVLVIDIGGKFTTATIISKGQAVLTRTIEFGVELVNETIHNSFVELQGTTIDENIKKEYDHYLQELIKPQIEYNIISELERILQFYYSRFENKPIKKIYLIGGGVEIRGIKTYIREALNIPTHRLKEFSTVIENPEIEFAAYRNFFVNLLGAIHCI